MMPQMACLVREQNSDCILDEQLKVADRVLIGQNMHLKDRCRDIWDEQPSSPSHINQSLDWHIMGQQKAGA